jgi:hypothetical protein
MTDKRTCIFINTNTHHAAKVVAAEIGVTMKDAADQAFELWIAKQSRPAKSQKNKQK